MHGRVLIVAGSDSGGGAGIQADLKTVTALEAYGATAITALTAQNTVGVHGILPIDPDFIAQQMTTVLDDIGADCVKTGMLHSAAVIERVAAVLKARTPGIPVVVDPVMVAKGGAKLLEDDAVAAMAQNLVSGAAVVTPNAPEAEVLTGIAVHDRDRQTAAGRKLVEMGARAALVKGGHVDSGPKIYDVLISADGETVFESDRIETANTHGTGCTLASAIAAGIAQGLTLTDAVARAHRYVAAAIEAAPDIGAGNGPLNHAVRI